MPWTETIDSATGERKRFWISPDCRPKLTTVYVGENWRGGPWCAVKVFGLKYNRSRYGQSWQERKFRWKCNAEKTKKQLIRKGYSQFEFVEYTEGQHAIED